MSAPAVRGITTPEGVPLHFEVAGVFERYSAFAFDGFLVLLATAFLAIPVLVLDRDGGWPTAVLLLAAFLLRHGYFVWFEVRRQGSTPGKRRAGIRVVDRGGGTLTAEAVFARNLTREVEVFIPLALLVEPRALLSEAPVGAALLGSAWVLVLAVLPCFNRDRLRIGDLIAGTMVVRAPAAVLLRDLSAVRGAAPRERFTFTPAQLGVYGIYELQVLEEVLRSPQADQRGIESVCDRIKRKIGWSKAAWKVPPREFLQDFYDAQRANLESRLLMGERKERKAEEPRRRGKR